jgi:hypothetical protein
VRQLPEARELRWELANGDGGAVALPSARRPVRCHGEGQGGAHELQRVEAAVVCAIKRRRGWKGVAGGSRDDEHTGEDGDDRYGPSP